MDPRIAALRARVATLSPEERAAFRARVEAAGIDWSRVAPPAARPDRLPLSPSQMQFWLTQQVQPDSAAFSIAFAWRIEGALDRDALRRALTHLLARHEPLRSAFPAEDGRPWQDIRAVDFAFDPPGAEGDFAARPFDLARAPLFRAQLVELGPDLHDLRLSFHHIIADGWSRGVFLRELAECYAAFHGSRAPDLASLPRQFADLALDQAAWLASPQAAAQEDFWRGELAGMAVQELPAPHAGTDRRAGTLIRDLNPILAARVAPMAAAMGVTPFVLLLAVFQLLLHRMTGYDDIAVGTPTAGRDSPDSAALIGLFVNTLVLRNRVQAGMSFRDWLAQVRDGFARAFRNQDLPFARVVEISGAERRAGQTPLFQTLFQVQTGYGAQNAETLDLAGLRIGQRVIPLPDAKFDLSWHMMDRDGRIGVIAEYRPALFDRAWVEAMLARFETLLASALDRPDASIERLEFLPSGAVTVLRGADAAIPDRTGIAPTAQLVWGDEVWDARALDAAVTVLARRLRARAELADAPVAICLPRGPQMVIAMLAALRAGIPYVPLDPTHPEQRRAGILADAGAGLVLDADHPMPDGAEADLPAPDPDRIAYVIFTSGSTGRPKGVPVTHRALSNLIDSVARAPGMGPGDRMLALTTIAFDIAALEILLPLHVGGTLVLGDATIGAEPDRLAQAITRHGITHMQATPATWRLLVDGDWQGAPLTALCGGEALASDLGRALIARTDALWNMYGPTETTIWSAARRVTEADLTGPQARIGGPVANTVLQILDRYGQALPAGLPGELAIGGAGLSPGYWHRPDLTSDRFRGGLYLTGDRARLEDDGTISFLGRLDHQIKLNGHRIEPGEIEAVLRGLAGISDAVVMAQDGRLVAWCCGADAPSRQALAAHLPGYMIPQVFVMLDAFPLNPNGKIDRARLPRPDAVATGSRAPETGAERILQAIWAQVLGRDDIGVDANFFDLGGASVSAMQIASRARAQGLNLTPAQMFEHQTIAAQAAAVRVVEYLPLSPWQAVQAGGEHHQRIPVPSGEGLATVLDALRAAHPVLRFELTPQGWRTEGGAMWSARILDGMLDLRADRRLLDAGSFARLGRQIVAGLQGAAPVPDESYLRWLKQPANPLPRRPRGAAAAEPFTQTLPGTRATAQVVAAAISRVLAAWAGTGSVLLVRDAASDGLGNFTGVVPVGGAVEPDRLVTLDWGGHDLPFDPGLLIEARPGPGTLTLIWHPDPPRIDRATISRLAARLAGELGAEPASNKLDRLRARLNERG